MTRPTNIGDMLGIRQTVGGVGGTTPAPDTGDLTDVDYSGGDPSSGDVLIWDPTGGPDGDGAYVPGPPPAGGIDVKENNSIVLAGATILDFTTGLDAANAGSGRATIGVDPTEIKLDDLGTPDDNTDLNASTSRHGLLRKLDNNSAHFLDGTGAWATPSSGGSVAAKEDNVTVVAAATAFDFTTGLDVADAGSGRATVAVDPTEIKLDDLGTPDDNTDLNASTSRHGLLRKLDNDATHYLDGTGAWSAPAGGGGGGGGGAANSFSGAVVTNSGATSLNNASRTTVLFDTESYDTDGYHSTSSNTGRLTIPATGYYAVEAGGKFSLGGTTECDLIIRKGGATDLAISTVPLGTAIAVGATVVWEGPLTAGDYLELQTYIDGATRTLGSQFFAIHRIDAGAAGPGTGIGCRAYASGTQSISNTTITAILFDTEDFDTDGFHSTSSNTNRFTVPVGLGGKYLAVASAPWDTNTANTRYMWFRKNGADVNGGGVVAGLGISAGLAQTSAIVLDLAAGDYVEVVTYQDSGGTRTLGNAGGDVKFRAWMSVMRLGGGGGTGTGFGQENPYPASASLSGNDDPMSATTNWADVNAFPTKEVLDGTVLHLADVGPSIDGRVRYTLPTTRAGAFDFRFYGVLLSGQHWGGDFDTYMEIYLTTSGGTGMAMVRLGTHNSPTAGMRKIRVGQTGVATTNGEPTFAGGFAVDIKIVRDGSNNVSFFWRSVGAPGWFKILKQSDNKPYTFSSSGTIARVELALAGPSGPGAAEHVVDMFVDTFKDAS